MWDIYAREYYSALQKKDFFFFFFFAICNSMDEFRGHCTKLNRPNTERQKLHDVTHMWNLKS